MKQIKISEVLSLLEKGYVRLDSQLKNVAEGEEKKSIQSYYNLTGTRVAEIFKHPKLKGKMTNYSPFELVDDTEDTFVDEVVTETTDVENLVNEQEVLS